MRPLPTSLCFGGSGFAGADAVSRLEGDEEHASIAQAAQSVKTVFQIVVIGANNTFNFSSDTRMLRSGIKLTTCDQKGVPLRGFPLKESSTLSLSASSIGERFRN